MSEPPVRRKRALSFAGYSELPKISSNVQFGQLPTATRIRHPSIVHSEGFPALDGLYGGVSWKLNNEQSGFPPSKSLSDVKERRISGYGLRSRKSSIATVVDHPLHSCISTPEISPKVPSSCSDSVAKVAQPSSLLPFKYSDYILPDSPLSSNLVKLYLAKVGTSNSVEHVCPNNSSQSKSPQTSLQNDHCLPEYLQIHPPTLASMVMPVNQITRVHGSQNKSVHISPIRKSDKFGNSVNIYLNGQNALTDTSYSSEFSDGESWGHRPICDLTNTGYLSDNHLIEAVSKAKMFNMSKRQLEMRLNIRPGSNSISPNRTKTNSNENLNYTYLKPKFEFTHVYDGLIPSSSDVISSTNKSFSKFRYNSQSNLNSVDNGFNGVKSSACYSMPGSPNTHSKYPHLMGQGDSSELIEDFNNYNTDNPIVTNSINNNNNNHNHTHTGRFERLRDLLGTFKKENHSTTQQNDHYLYLDEKSLEHRIQCQASNIILPVSF